MKTLLILLPTMLAAQVTREHDPVLLKHWPAPLYWQAPQPEAATTAPANPTALVFVAMTPCRLADTRQGSGFTGAFGPPSLVGGQIRTFPIQSNTTCPVPTTAQAYSLNLTVVPIPPQYAGTLWLTLYPATVNPQPPPPNVSTLNEWNGLPLANAAIIQAGTDGHGGVDVYANVSGGLSTDLVIDINGYYAAPGDLNGNTALGIGALANNTASFNTATGNNALANNTTGFNNAANGFDALQYNTSGLGNAADGAKALAYNTTGSNDMASGAGALENNTTGSANTATGGAALLFNTTGSFNTASGFDALYANTTGSNNVAIGNNAASNVSGNNSNNIHIGSRGAASDSGTIRIGDPANHTSFFAAGIRGVTTGNNDAIPVVIDSNGQLGTVSSSARFKEDIRDMGDASSGLLRLRPVTFRYRQPFADGSKPIEYGLIAEEVEPIYPDLVAHSADGQIESVKYQVLDSMLLNELQKQAVEIRLLQDELAALKSVLGKAPAQ